MVCLGRGPPQSSQEPVLCLFDQELLLLIRLASDSHYEREPLCRPFAIAQKSEHGMVFGRKGPHLTAGELFKSLSCHIPVTKVSQQALRSLIPRRLGLCDRFKAKYSGLVSTFL